MEVTGYNFGIEAKTASISLEVGSLTAQKPVGAAFYGVIVQPVDASGLPFKDQPVFLKLDANTSEAGFVFCDVCEYTYNVESKNSVLKENKELKPQHIEAQMKRCGAYQNAIEAVQQKIEPYLSSSELELSEEERNFDWLDVSAESSVSDSSETDIADCLAYESTQHALFRRRLQKLRERRDRLQKVEQAKLKFGKSTGKPWASNSDWAPDGNSADGKKLAKRVAARKERRLQRAERIKARQARRGPSQLVAAPNTEWQGSEKELKKRDKAGWLNGEAEEEMDEEEQDALTKQRRDAWIKAQGVVPKIVGSVQRQRWAQRIYRLPRRTWYMTKKIEQLEKEENRAEATKWKNRLVKFQDATAVTRLKVQTRLNKLKSQGRDEKLREVENVFAQAELIGKKEVADEIAERERLRMEAEERARQEEEARLKAEAKAKMKAEAEARGEVWVDPDAEDEGDEGEEEDD